MPRQGLRIAHSLPSYMLLRVSSGSIAPPGALSGAQMVFISASSKLTPSRIIVARVIKLSVSNVVSAKVVLWRAGPGVGVREGAVVTMVNFFAPGSLVFVVNPRLRRLIGGIHSLGVQSGAWSGEAELLGGLTLGLDTVHRAVLANSSGLIKLERTLSSLGGDVKTGARLSLGDLNGTVLLTVGGALLVISGRDVVQGCGSVLTALGDGYTSDVRSQRGASIAVESDALGRRNADVVVYSEVSAQGRNVSELAQMDVGLGHGLDLANSGVYVVNHQCKRLRSREVSDDGGNGLHANEGRETKLGQTLQSGAVRQDHGRALVRVGLYRVAFDLGLDGDDGNALMVYLDHVTLLLHHDSTLRGLHDSIGFTLHVLRESLYQRGDDLDHDRLHLVVLQFGGYSSIALLGGGALVRPTDLATLGALFGDRRPAQGTEYSQGLHQQGSEAHSAEGALGQLPSELDYVGRVSHTALLDCQSAYGNHHGSGEEWGLVRVVAPCTYVTT